MPALPGPLISSFVLSQLNWRGARSDDEAADAPKQGRSWAFVRRYKAQVGQIILVAFVWSCSIFVAPLSMNLLLSYIQDKASTPCSPYVFVVGLLAGPVIASLTLQNRCAEIDWAELTAQPVPHLAARPPPARAARRGRVREDATDASGRRNEQRGRR